MYGIFDVLIDLSTQDSYARYMFSHVFREEQTEKLKRETSMDDDIISERFRECLKAARLYEPCWAKFPNPEGKVPEDEESRCAVRCLQCSSVHGPNCKHRTSRKMIRSQGQTSSKRLRKPAYEEWADPGDFRSPPAKLLPADWDHHMLQKFQEHCGKYDALAKRKPFAPDEADGLYHQGMVEQHCEFSRREYGLRIVYREATKDDKVPSQCGFEFCWMCFKKLIKKQSFWGREQRDESSAAGMQELAFYLCAGCVATGDERSNTTKEKSIAKFMCELKTSNLSQEFFVKKARDTMNPWLLNGNNGIQKGRSFSMIAGLGDARGRTTSMPALSNSPRGTSLSVDQGAGPAELRFSTLEVEEFPRMGIATVAPLMWVAWAYMLESDFAELMEKRMGSPMKRTSSVNRMGRSSSSSSSLRPRDLHHSNTGDIFKELKSVFRVLAEYKDHVSTRDQDNEKDMEQRVITESMNICLFMIERWVATQEERSQGLVSDLRTGLSVVLRHYGGGTSCIKEILKLKTDSTPRMMNRILPNTGSTPSAGSAGLEEKAEPRKELSGVNRSAVARMEVFIRMQSLRSLSASSLSASLDDDDGTEDNEVGGLDRVFLVLLPCMFTRPSKGPKLFT